MLPKHSLTWVPLSPRTRACLLILYQDLQPQGRDSEGGKRRIRDGGRAVHRGGAPRPPRRPQVHSKHCTVLSLQVSPLRSCGPATSQSSHEGVGLLSSPISHSVLVSLNQEASVPSRVWVIMLSLPGQPARWKAQAGPWAGVPHCTQKTFMLDSSAHAPWWLSFPMREASVLSSGC